MTPDTVRPALIGSGKMAAVHARNIAIDRIERLNAEYRAITCDHHATYLDLWPALADQTGAVRSELSLDARHLNGAGYRAWVSVLRPHVLAPPAEEPS